jgi:hypothetical protein
MKHTLVPGHTGEITLPNGFSLQELINKSSDCICLSMYHITMIYQGRIQDLQLPMQSVPITTNVVSSNPFHGEMYSIQHYVIKFVTYLRQVGGFLRYSGFLHQ